MVVGVVVVVVDDDVVVVVVDDDVVVDVASDPAGMMSAGEPTEGAVVVVVVPTELGVLGELGTSSRTTSLNVSAMITSPEASIATP